MPVMKGSRSLQGSPDTSSSTGSNTSTNLPLTRQSSDPGIAADSPRSESTYHRSNSTSSNTGSGCGHHQHRVGTESEDIVIITHQDLMSQADTETIQVCTASSPSYSELPELVHTRSLALQHSNSPSDEGGINWLYDFYPSVLASSPKDKLDSFEEQQQQQQQGHSTSPSLTKIQPPPPPPPDPLTRPLSASTTRVTPSSARRRSTW